MKPDTRGVFEVVNYESDLRFSKFKMADPKWRINAKNDLILMKLGTRKF